MSQRHFLSVCRSTVWGDDRAVTHAHKASRHIHENTTGIKAVLTASPVSVQDNALYDLLSREQTFTTSRMQTEKHANSDR